MSTWQKNGAFAGTLRLTCRLVTNAMLRSKWQCGMSSGGSRNICSAVPIVVTPQFGVLYCKIPLVEHVTLSSIICMVFYLFLTIMSLPHLVSPPPDARLKTPFEDREAQARLKLHLLMARLRTALRTVMQPGWRIPRWKVHLHDEMVRTLFCIQNCTNLLVFLARNKYLPISALVLLTATESKFRTW